MTGHHNVGAPHKDDAPGMPAEGVKGQGKDYTAIVAPTSADHQTEPATLAEKARATLAAQLALAGGHVLLELADGSFIVTNWGMTRHCPDLQAVARFARQLGVRT